MILTQKSQVKIETLMKSIHSSIFNITHWVNTKSTKKTIDNKGFELLLQIGCDFWVITVNIKFTFSLFDKPANTA